MAVDAHLPRAVAARGVVADKPAGVVFRGLEPNGMLQLGDDGKVREHALAIFGGADDTFGINKVD